MRSMRVRAAAIAAAFTVAAAVGTAGTPAQADAIPPLPRIKANANVLYAVSPNNPVFTPRGANFVRLAQRGTGSYHSLFEPGRFNQNEAIAILDGMRHDGYNTVRVFVDPGVDKPGERHGLATGAEGTTNGLNPNYLSNLRTFVALAIPRGIYVLLTTEGYPHNTYYENIIRRDDGGTLPLERANDFNVYFTDRGHVSAKRDFMRNLTWEMSTRLGPYKTGILAYEIENEAFWNMSYPPFDRMSGSFTNLDGTTYPNMGVVAQRRAAGRDSVVIFAREVSRAVKEIDPDAMVTIGTPTNFILGKPGFDAGFQFNCFRPDASEDGPCGKTDDPKWRVGAEAVYLAAWLPSIDFIDMHVYPYPGQYTIAADFDTSELRGMTKPFILGELGADKRSYGNNLNLAANDMRERQKQSCQYPRPARGWLFFTWDTDLVTSLGNMGYFYSLQTGQGAINGALAPLNRSNPCA